MHKFLLLAPLSLSVLSSCNDDEIRTYKVATDSTSPSPLAADSTSEPPQEAAPHDHESHAGSVVWQAPGDWKQEKASQFLTAGYTLPSGGRVTVSKLAGDGGGLAANINRWRGQVGFKPLADHEVIGHPLKIANSEEVMQLFNLTSEDAATDAEGILAGVLPLKSETWYFKFTGPTAVLRKNEAVFGAFLSTVRISGGTQSAPASAPVPTSNGVKKIHVSAPDGWTPSEGSSMRAASFSIAGPDDTTADVSVIPIPGDSGSILDNVNRWRAQLQLPPLASADDPLLGEKTETPAGEIFTTHMTSTEPIMNGKKAAITTAILQRPGMTWFFKVTGEAALVQSNLEKFDSMVSSATFPE